MRTTNYKQIALIIAVIIAVAATGLFLVNNNMLKNKLKKEKISSETLLSEKLILDKSVEKMKSEMNDLKGKNSQLDKKIATIAKEIEEKEAQLRKAMAENYSLRSVRAKVKELEMQIGKLNAEHNALKIESKNEKEKLALENQELSKKLADSKKDNDQLAATNAILRAMAGNNYLVEAVRGNNDVLTVRARRTQKLTFSFDLPNDVGNNIEYKLYCPEGKVYASNDNKNATVKVVKNSQNFYENIDGIGEVETKTIQMSFLPEKKLAKGEYEFKIYNEGRYVGSNHFRLR